MIAEKNVTYLYIANVTTGLADGVSVDVSTLPAGAVVVANVTTGLLVAEESAISATGVYEIIGKTSDGVVVRSPKFKGSDIIAKNYSVYAPPVEQVKCLGCDGTTITGLGTITVGVEYIIGIWLDYTKGMYDQKGEVKHISALAKTTSQWDLVDTLKKSFASNFSPFRMPVPAIKCDRIADGTYGSVITGVTVTKGSTTVTKTAHLLSGGYVRISPSGAPGVTSKVFKIVSVTTDAFVIDVPWDEDTTSTAQIANTAAVTNCGLKFTGLAQPFDPITDYPTQVTFSVLTDSFGDYGTEYEIVHPFPGNGTYAQVAELETYAQFNEKWGSNSTYPPANFKKDAIPTNTYNMASVVVKPTMTIDSTGTVIANPFTLVLAVKAGLAAPAINTIFG